MVKRISVRKRKVSKTRRRSSKRKVSKTRRRSSKRRVSKTRRRLSKRRVSRRKQQQGGTMTGEDPDVSGGDESTVERTAADALRRMTKELKSELDAAAPYRPDKTPTKKDIRTKAIRKAEKLVDEIKQHYMDNKEIDKDDPLTYWDERGNSSRAVRYWVNSDMRRKVLEEIKNMPSMLGVSPGLFGRGRILRMIKR